MFPFSFKVIGETQNKQNTRLNVVFGVKKKMKQETKQKEKNLYLKHKEKVEKKINDFPMVWAFNEEQLNEGLNKLNATKKDVCSLPHGGIIRKTDKELYLKMWEDINAEEDELKKNPAYVYQMFKYELSNHEYIITYDLEDTLNACGISEDDLNANEMFKTQLEKAEKDYLKAMKNTGW
jgi:hypothetical protein